MKSRNNSISRKFFLFVLLSALFWFITKLSREYEVTISYPVTYENLPKDKLLQGQLQEEIAVHIKTTGFRILSETLFTPTIRIESSNLYSKSNNSYYLLIPQQRLSIQKQMRSGINIDHFIKDSINFNLGLLKRKKVPVKLLSNISYAAGFDIEGALRIHPDSIIVIGPEQVIDTIDKVETNNYVGREIKEDLKEELSLKKFSKESNVRFDIDKILFEASVEKYTEGTLEVTFEVKNLPEGSSIVTYPKEVKLTYKIALSEFNNVNTSLFQVECDYQMSANNGLSYLVPKITKQPNFVKNVKLTPNKIDFVIEK